MKNAKWRVGFVFIPHPAFRILNSKSPGGEVGSRPAYTRKSEGQNLPGRPLPCGIIRSAPVSDTGGGSAQAPRSKTGRGSQFHRHAPNSMLKFSAERRVRARGLQNFLGHHGPCRPGALTGRILQQAAKKRAGGAESK